MAKKVTEQTINVKEIAVSGVGKLLKSEEGKYYENKLAAFIAIEQTLSELEVVSKMLEDDINNTPVNVIVEDLYNRGLLLSKDYNPVFSISLANNKGEITDRYKVTLKQSESVKFDIDKDLNNYLDIVDPKYKEEKVTLNKKTIKEDYHKDSLDAFIKPYVSETKTSVTKIAKKKDYDLKEGKDE